MVTAGQLSWQRVYRGQPDLQIYSDFGGKTAVDPANVTVTPLTGPAGLSFEFPTVTPPKREKVSVLYGSEVRSSDNLASARLSGNLDGKDVRIHWVWSVSPKSREIPRHWSC